MGLFDRKSRGEQVAPDLVSDTGLPGQLIWLADAPLFLDSRRVDALYDAIFRPDYGETDLTLQNKVNRSTKVGAGATLGSMFPGLFAKAEATLGGDYTRGKEDGRTRTLVRISNSYRHLLALVLHYSLDPEKQPRLVLARTPIAMNTDERGDGLTDRFTDGTGKMMPPSVLLPPSEYIRTPPRAMIMLDLEAGCKLIPAAVELTDGGVEPLFEDLEKAVGKPAPPYPGSHAPLAARDKYWQWFAENVSDRHALKVIEDAAKDQRIEWIAYRVSLNDDKGPFIHMTLSAGGEYDTAVFGYNFVNRGTKHGLRIVGTLKSEPDIDVLAVFER
jgi:hypothetical protein